MIGARVDLDLADMANMPMSAGWYHEIGYLRDVIKHLATRHEAAVKAKSVRNANQLERDMTALHHAASAIEHIDRLRRTMEAADVLKPDA